MERIDSKNLLVSSSGRRFNHPDKDAIARILFHSDKPTLRFNYRSADNKQWDRANWKEKLRYQT